MASANSGVTKVTTGTSVRNRKTSYYKTEVTELGDGGLKSTVYRTDAQGNNAVAIQDTTVDKTGKLLAQTTTSNASTEEKKSLTDPNSQLRQAKKSQITDIQSKLYGNNATQEQKEKLDKVNGGSGNKSGSGDNTGDGTNPANLQAATSQAKDGTRNENFGSYVYPLSIRNTKQDVIKFSMLKYQPQTFSGSSSSFGFSGRQSNRNSIGSVILPIPGGIQDTNAVQWGGQSMTAAEAAAANLALTTITQGFGEGGKVIEETTKQVQENSDEVKTAVAAAFASAATGIGAQLLTRTTGAVLNPNLELLFSGPTLRPFSFNFKLSARSAEEGKEILKIIRFFKQGMAPIRSQSNLFLKSPHTFKIQYLDRRSGEKDHYALNKFKECALQSFNVQYTPEGNYATFEDGIMTSYQITMQFQELEPVFNDDYGNGTFPAEIGY